MGKGLSIMNQVAAHMQKHPLIKNKASVQQDAGQEPSPEAEEAAEQGQPGVPSPGTNMAKPQRKLPGQAFPVGTKKV